MSLNVCTHFSSSLLHHEEGILCTLCNALRLAAINPKYALSMAMEKLSTWTARSPPSIDVLPNEILIEIFQHYLSSGPTIYLADKPTHISSSISFYSSPIPLTHVCRSWREVAISTPLLWSYIAVHNPRRNNIPLIDLWLQRAGSCPLSVCIHQGRSSRELETDATLEMFIAYCHQWRSIDIRLSKSFQPALMNLPEAGPLRTLEQARLHIPYFIDSDRTKTWAGVLSSPHISSVLWSIPLSNFRNVPWGQLKVIDYRYPISINDALHILNSCPNLEDLGLILDSCDRDTIYALPEETIFLPYLKKLRLRDFREHYSTIFDAITAPRLTSLNIDLIDSDETHRHAFREFMERSRCWLQTIIFISCSIEAAEFLQWLEIPGMATLTKTDIHIKTKFSAKDFECDPHQDHIESLKAGLIECIHSQ